MRKYLLAVVLVLCLASFAIAGWHSDKGVYLPDDVKILPSDSGWVGIWKGKMEGKWGTADIYFIVEEIGPKEATVIWGWHDFRSVKKPLMNHDSIGYVRVKGKVKKDKIKFSWGTSKWTFKLKGNAIEFSRVHPKRDTRKGTLYKIEG
jgi:hypothetical protein